MPAWIVQQCSCNSSSSHVLNRNVLSWKKAAPVVNLHYFTSKLLFFNILVRKFYCITFEMSFVVFLEGYDLVPATFEFSIPKNPRVQNCILLSGSGRQFHISAPLLSELNARSCKNKTYEIESLTIKGNSDNMFITETWLRDNGDKPLNNAIKPQTIYSQLSFP